MQLDFREVEKKQENREMIVFLITIAILCGLALILFAKNADAKDFQTIQPADINIEKLADAIYIAEGGDKATYLYGIRSVNYDTTQEARRICKNTIRNNFKRYKDYGRRRFGDYLEFLGSRYAPTENCENDPKGLNSHWISNVRSIYLKLMRSQ